MSRANRGWTRLDNSENQPAAAAAAARSSLPPNRNSGSHPALSMAQFSVLASLERDVRLFKEQVDVIAGKVRAGKGGQALTNQFEACRAKAEELTARMRDGVREGGRGGLGEMERLVVVDRDFRLALKRLQTLIDDAMRHAHAQGGGGGDGGGDDFHPGLYQGSASVYPPMEDEEEGRGEGDGEEPHNRQAQASPLGHVVTDAMLQEESLRQAKLVESEMGALAELFRDVQVLVRSQHGMVHTLEENVESTVLRTEGGVKELNKAMEDRLKERQRKRWLMALVAVAIAILFLAYFGTRRN